MPVQTLDFRTDDLTRWGLGYGSDLPAGVIDLNFWKLFTGIEALENSQSTTVSIDYMNLVGDQLYIHLTDHSVQGPFTVPHTVWNPRGPFIGGVTYQPLDVIDNGNGSLYVVNVAHTSVAPFDPHRTDGQGHDLYTLLLSQPQSALPTGGLLGQRLVKSSGSPFVTAWAYDRIRLNLLIGGSPDPSELLLQHLVDEPMILPAGLQHSLAYSALPATSASQFHLARDGAPIGSITFAPSPLVTVDFPIDVAFVAGNVLTMTGPAVQDPSLTNISFNIVAYLASAE
jgi:hypothetical protein